jgi:hypothetical protein
LLLLLLLLDTAAAVAATAELPFTTPYNTSTQQAGVH